jgi:hypothetical protein
MRIKLKMMKTKI